MPNEYQKYHFYHLLKKKKENSVFQRRGLLKDDTSQETLYCVNIVFQPKKNYIYDIFAFIEQMLKFSRND